MHPTSRHKLIDRPPSHPADRCAPPGATRRQWLGAVLAGGGAAAGAGWLLARSQRPSGTTDAGLAWTAVAPSQLRFAGVPLLDLDGSPAALPATSDRLRVLNLWARWCGPCRRELPGLARLARRLSAEGIALGAVALDDDAFALREFLRDLPLADLPVSRLPPRLWPAGWVLDSLPQTWLIGRRGELLARIVGARDWDDAAWLPRLAEVNRIDLAGSLA